MPVNLEVKGTLAKLLATEDLIVEHRSVSTASFNVQSRVLTLPRWERATSNVVDLLVAHEVGHALFTPNVDFRKKTSCPMGFINVTEDVRIENLMKQKYAGLPKTFYKGYHELHDQDFFGVEDEDISEMNVADRVNLHFKVGNFVQVPFSDEEMVVVKQTAAARTFDEAIAAAEALYALHQQQKEEQKQSSQEEISAKENQEEQPSTEGSGESEQPEFGETEQELPETETDGVGENVGESEVTEEGEEESEGEEVEEEHGGGGTSAGNLNDDVTTMDNLNDAIESMTNTSSWNEPVYATYPKMETSKYVVANSDIHQYVQNSWNTQKKYFREHCGSRYEQVMENAFGVHYDKFAKFKSEIKSEVNYMVKEFECKKSAEAYARASTSRTGILDCSKLHTFKYNEDLFKKVTTLPEGKNHGLLFVLDWSGSMCDILEDTMKQLLSLVMFCDKVGIPFDVYAFTNEWKNSEIRERGEYVRDEIEEEGVFHLGNEFGMMNILTSKVNRKELQRQMQTMYVIASSYSTRSFDIVPSRVGLSGTPLNEALVLMRSLLPEFKAKNNIQKAHVMVLTDGEAAPLRLTKMTESYDGSEKLISSRIYGNNCYIRNRSTGMVTKVPESSPSALTTALLEDLRSQFPESTFTGFRILESRGGWFVRQATGYDDALQSQWRKEKSIALTNFGYNKYYIVSATSIQESADFEVAEDATKAKIKSAFAKSLKSKKNNKKILGDFIGLIA